MPYKQFRLWMVLVMAYYIVGVALSSIVLLFTGIAMFTLLLIEDRRAARRERVVRRLTQDT